MHPATLHGVGVITKLYFAIFAACKESMTEPRSEVIQDHRFWYLSKARIRISGQQQLGLHLAPFQRYAA